MNYCFCFSGTPDWNAITAISTAVLAFGVLIAWYQLVLQRRGNRVVETGRLLEAWNDNRLWDARSWLDIDAYDWKADRRRVVRFYTLVQALKRRRFRPLQDFVNDIIEDHARLAERIEIYIRKGAADEGIIGDHIAYDVIMAYFTLEDVLKKRAAEDDLSYEGFRDLALRLQDYAKIFSLDADLPGSLTWAQFTPLVYGPDDESQGYKKSPWRKVLLGYAVLRDFVFRSTRSANERRKFAGHI
jgi:hypothetical protein